MKARIAIALVSCCLLGGLLASAADDEGPSKPSELDLLSKQIRALEARVAVLENRLKAAPRDRRGRIQPPYLHGRPVPENRSRREFNGMPYYVIPLRDNPNRAPIRKK